MGSQQVSFSFRVEPPTDSLCYMLVSAMVFAFCFQVPMWLPCSPNWAQLLGFATLHPFGVYPQKAYAPPGDGQWPIPGVHQVAALNALSRGIFMLLIQLSPAIPQHGGANSLGAQQQVSHFLCLCYIVGEVFFSR